jgi:hypothetical protein
VFWILQKRLRSLDEIQLLDKALGTLRFFKEMKLKLSQQLYDTLLNTIQYKMRIKSAVLGQNTGEENTDFFVLLKGRIFLMVEKEIAISKNNSPNKDLRQSVRRNTRAKTIVSARSTTRRITTTKKEEAKSMRNIDLTESINLGDSQIIERRTSIMGSLKDLDLKSSISEESHKIIRNEKRKTTVRRLSTVFDPLQLSQEQAIGDLLKIDMEGSKEQNIETLEAEDISFNNQSVLMEIEEKYPNLRYQSVIRVGDSYGEASLTFKSRRKETLYVVEESHFAILNKEGFKEILGKN